tara:strand:- start:434 stop:865 length:432 start_codon:yes stop_codon:yes gene_type:complete
MTSIQRYRAADLPQLMEKIHQNSIGLDSYLHQFFDINQSQNYPPYNLVQLSNVESRLEIALAGFKKDEVKVFTEYGKLHVTGEKTEEKKEQEYLHRGMGQRSFQRQWALSDDSLVKSVDFEDGLLVIVLGKVVPEHHSRKEYL